MPYIQMDNIIIIISINYIELSNKFYVYRTAGHSEIDESKSVLILSFTFSSLFTAYSSRCRFEGIGLTDSSPTSRCRTIPFDFEERLL